MKTIRTIYDDSKKRRVVIFERDDGSFGFEEERFWNEPGETAWIPVGRPPRPVCRCDSIERALVEVRDRIDWLRGEGGSGCGPLG